MYHKDNKKKTCSKLEEKLGLLELYFAALAKRALDQHRPWGHRNRLFFSTFKYGALHDCRCYDQIGSGSLNGRRHRLLSGSRVHDLESESESGHALEALLNHEDDCACGLVPRPRKRRPESVCVCVCVCMSINENACAQTDEYCMGWYVYVCMYIFVRIYMNACTR
jgi:hypothetical protein